MGVSIVYIFPILDIGKDGAQQCKKESCNGDDIDQFRMDVQAGEGVDKLRVHILICELSWIPAMGFIL